MNRKKSVTLLLALLMAMSGCDRQPQAPLEVSDQITIMTFNVENLFDTRDDRGKDDQTFLPLSAKQTRQHREGCAQIERRRWRAECFDLDWNEAVLKHKLRVLAKAILQVGNGRGPDILALQEVENVNVLEQLRRDYLQAADYLPGILIEGNDRRGIDVAFLSRLPLDGAAALHPIPLKGFGRRATDSRGILEATFKLPGGGLLTGYAVHFPAPYNPREMRVQGYQFLNQLRARLPEGRPAFAAGDFNTPASEDAAHQMLSTWVAPVWRIAHQEGCPGCPQGSSYFPPDRSWSYLDMILWSAGQQSDKAGWRLRADATFVANATPDQVRRNGTPANFRPPQRQGVSDHWPVVATIENMTAMPADEQP